MALILYAKQLLTEDNRLNDEANRQVAISDAGLDIVDGATQTYQRRTYAVSLYTSFTDSGVDPDDF